MGAGIFIDKPTPATFRGPIAAFRTVYNILLLLDPHIQRPYEYDSLPNNDRKPYFKEAVNIRQRHLQIRRKLSPWQKFSPSFGLSQ